MPTYKIHPAIGFARIGNSPAGFFIGPEKRHELLAPSGGFKDSKCRIKRQAARFRIFVYPDDGSPATEYVPAPGDVVTWEVSLTGNISGASAQVVGADATTSIHSARLIDTDHPAKGHVLLAELRTDARARLLVLGGLGWVELASTGGYDDTCDGYVHVTVATPSSNLKVAPAWVVISPPKYAPQLESIVTVYDALEQRVQGNAPVTTPTSYTEHIYPILRRAASMQWLDQLAVGHHTWDLTNVASLPRNAIFKALKVPDGVTPPPGISGGSMPAIDELTLTPLQYARMRDFWSDTNFVSDWVGEPVPQTGEPSASELDRAALEACVGGPFKPGIEVSKDFLWADYFVATDPGRVHQGGLATDMKPGQLRKRLEPGWPGDYTACAQWPVVRPTTVPTSDGVYQDWDRDAEDRDLLAENWARLGFVEKQSDGTFLESERCSSQAPIQVQRRLGLLDRVRRVIDIVDPPPPDIGRLRQLVERVEDVFAPPERDELSATMEQLDQMNESELRGALLQARAAVARGEAATRLIRSKLEKRKRR
jgi:hypothetical protein